VGVPIAGIDLYAAGMAEMVHLKPFVLPTEARPAERHGAVDLYLPEAAQPRPAVVFLHGLVPADVRPTPRDWPVYRGYGSIAAARGVVGVTVDYRLHAIGDYPQAADEAAAAVQTVRADPRVDSDRVAIWVFSAAGLLLGEWLRTPPDWLRPRRPGDIPGDRQRATVHRAGGADRRAPDVPVRPRGADRPDWVAARAVACVVGRRLIADGANSAG